MNRLGSGRNYTFFEVFLVRHPDNGNSRIYVLYHIREAGISFYLSVLKFFFSEIMSVNACYYWISEMLSIMYNYALTPIIQLLSTSTNAHFS